MFSCYNCVGIFMDEPKRSYIKSKGEEIEVSSFYLNVKRSDGGNEYDQFCFNAYKGRAKYINSVFHAGDMVAVSSRPILKRWIDNQKRKRSRIIFYVNDIQFVAKRERVMLNQFGGVDFPELQDINYF